MRLLIHNYKKNKSPLFSRPKNSNDWNGCVCVCVRVFCERLGNLLHLPRMQRNVNQPYHSGEIEVHLNCDCGDLKRSMEKFLMQNEYKNSIEWEKKCRRIGLQSIPTAFAATSVALNAKIPILTTKIVFQLYIDIWIAKSITLIALFVKERKKKRKRMLANIICWMHYLFVNKRSWLALSLSL